MVRGRGLYADRQGGGRLCFLRTGQSTVRYNALFPTLTYRGSILSWRPVVGATAYDVQVGDGAVSTVDSGDSFCLIENAEKAGRPPCASGSTTATMCPLGLRRPCLHMP